MGDRVWVRNLAKGEEPHFDKLARNWSGPYEILEIVGGGRFCVATAQGPQILGVGRLKLALPLLSGVKLKCDHHTLRPPHKHDDSWVVEDVVNLKEVPSIRGNGKVQKWLVKWKGHQEWTWDTRDQFVHHVCDPVAGLQCQAWHSVPVMTSRHSPPPLGPLHSLRVTYVDYMAVTFTACHPQYLNAVPSTPWPTAVR